MFSFSTLEPNQYGLLRNFITKRVSPHTYRGGIKLTGPMQGFVKFPAAQVTLLFSHDNKTMLEGPIMTRAGGKDTSDEAKNYTKNVTKVNSSNLLDEASSGQTIQISCAIQYEFNTDTLFKVLSNLTNFEKAHVRYLRLASSAVSFTAQDFRPSEFWTDRPRITTKMFEAVNKSLWKYGFVMAKSFQILQVDFAYAFEQQIISNQVNMQQTEVNTFDKQVMGVVQEIEILRAENNAKIMKIGATANATARKVVADAQKLAFMLKQTAKAEMYGSLKDELNLSQDNMMDYLKIKSMEAQGTMGNKVTIGLSQRKSELPARTEL